MNNSNKSKNVYYLLLSYFNLALQCTTFQTSQTYFKILAVNAGRFLRCVQSCRICLQPVRMYTKLSLLKSV